MRKPTKCFKGVLVGVLLCSGANRQGQATSKKKPTYACPVVVEHLHVATYSGDMPVDHYQFAGIHSRGTVFALHSAAGILTTPTEVFDDIGQFALACAGFDVYLPHYLATSGVASVPNVKFAQEHAAEWLRDLRQVFASVVSDQRPSFLVGDSLGGYLALALQPTIKGVRGISLIAVGYTGLEPYELPTRLPVLDQLGTQDELVSLQQGRLLVSALRKKQCLVKSIEYQGVGHNLLLERRQSVINAMLSSMISLLPKR